MTLQNYNVTCSAVAVQIFSVHRSHVAPHLPIFGQSSCALYFFLVGHICLQCTAVISVIMQHLDRMCCMKLVLSLLTVVYICEFIDAREKNSNFFLKNLHKFAVTSGKFHDYRNHCTRWCVKHKDRNWVGMRKATLLVGAQSDFASNVAPSTSVLLHACCHHCFACCHRLCHHYCFACCAAAAACLTPLLLLPPSSESGSVSSPPFSCTASAISDTGQTLAGSSLYNL